MVRRDVNAPRKSLVSRTGRRANIQNMRNNIEQALNAQHAILDGDIPPFEHALLPDPNPIPNDVSFFSKLSILHVQFLIFHPKFHPKFSSYLCNRLIYRQQALRPIKMAK